MTELIDMIAGTGFPIAVSVYLLVKFQSELTKISEFQMQVAEKLDLVCDKILQGK